MNESPLKCLGIWYVWVYIYCYIALKYHNYRGIIKIWVYVEFCDGGDFMSIELFIIIFVLDVSLFYLLIYFVAIYNMLLTHVLPMFS